MSTHQLPPPDYELAYPDALIGTLTAFVHDWCAAIAVAPYPRRPDAGAVALLERAWLAFRDAAADFAAVDATIVAALGAPREEGIPADASS